MKGGEERIRKKNGRKRMKGRTWSNYYWTFRLVISFLFSSSLRCALSFSFGRDYWR